MPLQLKVKLSGPLAQGPSAFKEHLKQRLTAGELAARRRLIGNDRNPHHHLPGRHSAHPEEIVSLVAAIGLGPQGTPNCDGFTYEQHQEIKLYRARELASLFPGAEVVNYLNPEGNEMQYDVHFHRNYEDVVAGLEAAGYYKGILAWDPIYHGGLTMFRDHEPLGFHFGVTSEYREEMADYRYRQITFHWKHSARIPGTAIATHLHLDCENPLLGTGHAVNHLIDFLKKPFEK